MLVVAETYANLTDRFGTAIDIVRAGDGANIPYIDSEVLFFCRQCVDIRAVIMSEVLAMEFWSRNAVLPYC